ncbi:MAG TPA: MFS transporter [Bradyrhizobium sp.]|nr:MFS transporter [Bradyrhizobium sp.]
MHRVFVSLANRNYRIWAGGALVSNIGSWMQRTAQDWIVLTELTQHNATAVGIVMGLQFAPQILLLPLTGYAADHLDRRKLLFCTQAAMGLFALGLGLLVVTGLVQLWHVYVFAFLLGCAAAFDAPARQTFVTQLVEPALLANAVGLNSTSFNAARMVGPAIAGIVIAAVGSGYVFLINAASFVAVLVALAMLRIDRPVSGRTIARGKLTDGFRYVLGRSDLKLILSMLFLIGTFGLNFPIFISTMAVSVFHVGAGQFGLLTSMMAAGSVTGALLAAARTRPGIPLLAGAAAMFGVTCAVAAFAPFYLAFGLILFTVGVSAQTFTTSTNSLTQLSTDPAMRGRVIAILMALALGGTPIGAPIVGWVADQFGPRWALGVGAASGILAATIAALYLLERRRAQPGVGPA